MSNEPTQPVPPLLPANLWARFLAHFWKLFAVAALTCLTYVGHTAIGVWESSRATSVVLAREQQVRYSDPLTAWRGPQVKPATVVLKNSSTSVVGYYIQAEGAFATLAIRDPATQETEVTLIPWENVAYIRLTTKEPDKK